MEFTDTTALVMESVSVLTSHLHLCPPLYHSSHPVPHNTLVEAGVTPLQRRDGQPKQERVGLFCVLYRSCPKNRYNSFSSKHTVIRSSHSQRSPHQQRSTADIKVTKIT